MEEGEIFITRELTYCLQTLKLFPIEKYMY